MIDELTKKLVEDARDILEGKNPKEEEKEMDKVSGKELSKKFKDRDDKDIDNDGDTDDSDEYLHKRRQTIQKAIDVRPETARVRRSSSRNDQARRRTKPAPPNQRR